MYLYKKAAQPILRDQIINIYRKSCAAKLYACQSMPKDRQK